MNLRPTISQLRQFGIVAMCVTPCLTAFWTRDTTATAVSLLPAAAFGLVAWLQPRWLTPAFVTATVLAYPVGLVFRELVLLFIYFAVVTPIGLGMKLIGRDSLRLRSDADSETFWQRRTPPKSVRQYNRPW